MPESTQYMFDLKEVVEILAERQGLRKGHWGLAVKFGFNAAIVQSVHEGELGTRPTALLPVLRVGLQELDAPNDSSVDASKIGAAKRSSKRKTKATKKPRAKNKVVKKRPAKKKTAGKRK